MAVCSAIAEYKGKSVEDIDPLSSEASTTAMERWFESSTTNSDSFIIFTTHGCVISATGDGVIQVGDSVDAVNPTS